MTKSKPNKINLPNQVPSPESAIEIYQSKDNKTEIDWYKKSVLRKIEYYNLDAIISVGYRVNSKKGTQFRIWATERLKNHLTQGFTINEQRLKNYQKNLTELQQTIKLIQNSLIQKSFLAIITNYSRSFANSFIFRTQS